MKTLDTILQEKFIITKDTKPLNNINIILGKADYIIKSYKELREIDIDVFKNSQLISYIHSYIKSWPIYIFKLIDKEFDDWAPKIKQYREQKHINSNNFEQPKFFSTDQVNCMVILDNKTKYTEIFIQYKDKILGQQITYVIVKE